MRISVIGSGYVGLVTAACLAELGNDVFCLDTSKEKIDLLNSGGIPIHEPGLDDLVERNRKAGRLQFSTDAKASVAFGDIQFIAVGTPPDEDGSADLQYVVAAAKTIGQHMQDFRVVVVKSTVPVGTSLKVKAAIEGELKVRGLPVNLFSVASNPEFLKEGAAIEDFMRPDRIVVGTSDDEAGQKAKRMMRQLYAPFNRNHERTVYMDVRSSELTKYAANAMLATRISFMNELANFADSVGADIEAVRQGIGSDSRIGYSFLYSGTGYGGSCFPKDVKALIKTGAQHGHAMQILQSVEAVNDAQKHVLLRKLHAHYGQDLRGKHIAVWGLAFKPNTDDMREAPSRVVIAELLRAGATVSAFDPIATAEAQRCFAQDFTGIADWQSRLTLANAPLDALNQADALLILTEWKVFRSPDFTELKKRLRAPVILDGRNLYDPHEMAQSGFTYQGVGRRAA
jgi:UDPglucose 6-dehydrogenase